MAGPFTQRKPGGGSTQRGGDTQRGPAVSAPTLTHTLAIYAHTGGQSGPPGTIQQ